MKKRKVILVTMILAALCSGTAWAGQWQQNAIGWWYAVDNGGYPQGQWQMINGYWYYFNGNGYMTTGWNSIGGQWYFMNADGAMQTKWLSDDGSWYYLMPDSGQMITGWRKIDGNWYYFYSEGQMASEEWVDEYYLLESGKMAVNTKIDGMSVGRDGKIKEIETEDNKPVQKEPVDVQDSQSISTLRISGNQKYSTVNAGDNILITGIIRSNYNINNIEVKIDHDYSGKENIYIKVVNPGSLEVDLSTICDPFSISEDSEGLGNYILTITATDDSGLEKQLMENTFEIKPKQKAASTLTVSGESKPSHIEQGSWFGLYGTISSNYNIIEVTGSILSAGNAVQSKTVYPNTQSYDLQGEINDALIFNDLLAGNYVYELTAKDESGKNKKLIQQSFTVKAKQEAASTLSVSGESQPSRIEQGSWFGLYGTISSNYNITEVTGSILSAGNAVQSKTVYPNTQSYDLHGEINDALIFNNLSAGSYVYEVTAKDESGKSKKLIQQSFTVENDDINETEDDENAEKSYQSIDYRNQIIPYLILQKNSSDCGVASMATLEAYANKSKDGAYDKVYKNNGNSAYCNWTKNGYTAVGVSKKSNRYEMLYEQLKSGPCIVGNGAHYSLAVAYEGDGETVTANDFIIMDIGNWLNDSNRYYRLNNWETKGGGNDEGKGFLNIEYRNAGF